MRKIKFRVWDKDKEIMMHFKSPSLLSEYTKLQFDCEEYKGICEFPIGVEEDNIILMQFTGLYDKNGKEIYEGDILSDGYDEIREAKFLEWFNCDAFDCYGYDFASGEFTQTNDVNGGLKFRSKFEVIGNIWENPELITNSQV